VGPPDLTTLINTAVLSAQAGDFQHAEDRLLRALRLEPDQPEAHLNLAEVYAGRGRFEQAVAHYRRYLNLTPPVGSTGRPLRLRVAVLLKVADASSRAGRPEAARTALAEARALAAEAGDRELATQLTTEPEKVARSVSVPPGD